MQQPANSSSTGYTRLLLRTPADFARPLQKTDPLNNPASKPIASQQRAGEQQLTSTYSSPPAAVHNHPHYFLRNDESGRPVIYFDDQKPSYDHNVLQPLVQAPVAANVPCERCRNRSALEEEMIERLLLNPHKIEANNKLLSELEDLAERRSRAEAAQTASWKYAENYNTMVPLPIEANRRKSKLQKLPLPPLSPVLQSPPAAVFEEDYAHHQPSESSRDVHKHTQLLLQLATNIPEVEKETRILQEVRLDYQQERRIPRPADLELDFSASDSDDDDDKYPFGRCYTGSPLLPRDSLDSDTSSNRKSEETGEEEAEGSLNYLGSVPQPHNGASAGNLGQELQLRVGTNDRQV